MTVRPLALTWLTLIALTALSGFAAQVTGEARLGTYGLVALSALVIAKARLILAYYLRLGAAPSFLAGFTVAIAAVMGAATVLMLVPLRP